MLYPHHENDVIPVILKKPDHYRTLAVALHVGHRFTNELELLVDAGLSTIDALRAATVLPAEHFGLTDRGVVAPGLRADLVLIDGDPLHDIRAVRLISRVWCGGIEHTPARLAKQS